MNFTLSVYNISSCHFSKRRVENCSRKCSGLSSCMNGSCDKTCYPHDYITCAKPSWQVRSWAWKSCMILSDISNPARQPAQWKMKSVGWHLVQCFFFLIPSYLAARQLMLSLLIWVTAREWPLCTEDFSLPPEETVASISVFWLLVRWQGLGGMRSEQLWLSCVTISQWVPADG